MGDTRQNLPPKNISVLDTQAGNNLLLSSEMKKIIQREAETDSSNPLRKLNPPLNHMEEIYPLIPNDTRLENESYQKTLFKEAANWFRVAAEQGDVAAQNNLGYCHECGMGVVKDMKEAVRLYRLAAENGNARAQNNLSRCYEKGMGVVQDEKEALRLLHMAVDGRNAHAQLRLAKRYKFGNGVEKNYKETLRLSHLAAGEGNAEALYELSLGYRKGVDVEKDAKVALWYCEQAAQRGQYVAMGEWNIIKKARESQNKKEAIKQFSTYKELELIEAAFEIDEEKEISDKIFPEATPLPRNLISIVGNYLEFFSHKNYTKQVDTPAPSFRRT